MILFTAAVIYGKGQQMYPRNNPSFYTGTDSERMEQAMGYAMANGLPLQITARPASGTGDRDYWLIDRAILLPGGCEVQIIDCRIKLSDRCRDNIFRSANCGPGIPVIAPLSNIRIMGTGQAVLEGADHPRATGDAAKTLGRQTFGTDAGKADEHQLGDWRNIGILMAEVSDLAIENLELRRSHCWAISLEYCKRGILKNLRFASTQKTIIDNREAVILNQDGIDLRRGCSEILIENISGHSGDDLIALTALRSSAGSPAGGKSTMVSASFFREDDDIRNITIRNVRGYCAGGHHIIRLLNAAGTRIHHVDIENVMDTSPAGLVCRAAVKIGDRNPRWGGVTPLGDTHHIRIRKIRSKARFGIYVAGSLADSEISDILNLNPEGLPLHFESGLENIRNLKLN